MRFNVSKPPKHIQRELDEKARREWHKKFAWKAQKVDRTDEGHRVVWFENYWRKEKVGPTNSMEDDGRYFEQYSEKEYFKKKLNGDFEEHNFGANEAAEDIITQIKNQMNKRGGHIQNAGIHKKGGPNSNVKFKKYVANGDYYQVDRDIDGCIENVFLGDEEGDSDQ